MKDRDVMKAFSKPDLWKIFEHHADKLGVRLEIGMPSACPSQRIVSGCPIRGKLTLAAMLHELGHIATITGETHKRWVGLTESKKELEMMEEKIAWSWAKHNCPIWDNEMRDFARQAIISHNNHPEVGDQLLDRVEKELGIEVSQKLDEYIRVSRRSWK